VHKEKTMQAGFCAICVWATPRRSKAAITPSSFPANKENRPKGQGAICSLLFFALLFLFPIKVGMDKRRSLL
jgi:hypothetical protein